MKKYHKSLLLFLIFLFVFEGTVIYVAGLKRPYWGDEAHFVKTIRQFGEEISLQRIKNYNEGAAPLTFIVYSIWGRIFGFEIHILRIFAVIIAFATYISFHYLLFSLFQNSKIAFLATTFLVINPYMIGLSIFVFTDMLAILFLLAFCISISKSKPIIFALSSACALLTRQYLVFLIAAAGLYYLIKFFKKKNRYALYMLLSLFISVLPLAFLLFLWKGPGPPEALKYWYPKERFVFHISYLIQYTCLLFVYLLPIILLRWNYFYTNKKKMLWCSAMSLLYWLFPIVPSRLTLEQTHFVTIGLFHRFLKLILKNQFLEHSIFFVAFFAGLPVVFYFFRDCYTKWKESDFSYLFFLDLSIIVFLIIMPFAHLNWEKYILPLVPLASMRILFIGHVDGIMGKK